ncbi:hypothetical protein ABEF94_017145 [Exophiala dermatitidis]
MPNARIMTFRYDSSLLLSRSKAGIKDFALDLLNRIWMLRPNQKTKARPLIFVAHSLGGIVVKKALILSHENNRHYGNILTSTGHGRNPGARRADALFAKTRVSRQDRPRKKNLISFTQLSLALYPVTVRLSIRADFQVCSCFSCFCVYRSITLSMAELTMLAVPPSFPSQ